ncbi:MAG: hypothetical protein ACK5MN_02520 [Lachnospiraceae bacterium]
MISIDKIIEKFLKTRKINDNVWIEIKGDKKERMISDDIISSKLLFEINLKILKYLAYLSKEEKKMIYIKVGTFNDFVILIWELAPGSQHRLDFFSAWIARHINHRLKKNKYDGFIKANKSKLCLYLC